MTTPNPRSRTRIAQLSIAALMGLVAVVAAVSRWPWMVLPAAVVLAIYVDKFRLPLLHTALIILVLAMALAVALVPRMVHLRREMASQTGPKAPPNSALQRTRPAAAVSGNAKTALGGPVR